VNPERDAVRRATERLVWGMTLAAVFFMAARLSVDSDTWWHLRTGQWMWEQRAWPVRDPFSYTRAGHPWNPPGPPVQILMYAVLRVAGLWGLDVWTAGMVTVALAWVWAAMGNRARSQPFLQAGAVLWAAMTAAIYWAARPYLATFVLAAVYLWALETYRQGRAGTRRLWMLVPLMAVWANAHGGFIAGWLLWAAYALPAWWRAQSAGHGRAAARRWLGLGAGLVLAAALNPTGPARWLYPFQTVGIRALQAYIAEWQPPRLDDPTLWPFWAWWLGLIVVLAVARVGLPGEHLLLWLGFGVLAWQAVRHVALFALVAPVVWIEPAAHALEEVRAALPARWWSRWPRAKAKSAPRPRPRLNALLVLGFFLVGALKAWWPYASGQAAAHFAAVYPQTALAYLQHHRPQARLFNSYNWGGYLLWHWPEQQVFVDGRTDLYGDEILSQYLTVVRAEAGWPEVLARWEVDTVLLEPEMPIVNVLPRHGWVEAYRDDHAVVLVRLP